jgi:hypothetical protein
MTDLMVRPETLDAYMEANPLPDASGTAQEIPDTSEKWKFPEKDTPIDRSKCGEAWMSSDTPSPHWEEIARLNAHIATLTAQLAAAPPPEASGTAQDAQCPYVVTSREGTSYCQLNGPAQVTIPDGWMRNPLQVGDLVRHLEEIAWREDSNGDPDCVDQGAAMSLEVIRFFLLPAIAAPPPDAAT